VKFDKDEYVQQVAKQRIEALKAQKR